MSGIYIPDMEMPTNCADCEVLSDDLVCPFTGIRGYNGKPKICPLVEVPQHGRLIDAEALTDAIDSTDCYHQAPNKEMVHGANSAEHQAWYKEQDIYSAIENAPTIIPAEEVET